jgi:sec-independent protein translocase protein TatA
MSFGTNEMLIVLGVVVLLFGGKKIPELMRGVGKGVGELKRGLDEGKRNLDESINSVNNND